jgi:hypothetical protein
MRSLCGYEDLDLRAVVSLLYLVSVKDATDCTQSLLIVSRTDYFTHARASSTSRPWSMLDMAL